MKSQARQMALGGMMTAAAVVIMCMGSLIPVNTYVCPVLCILVTGAVRALCGRKFAFCQYLATAILSLLLAPDREAALVYGFLGYYPLIRPAVQRIRPGWLRLCLKVLFFTSAGAAAYGALWLLIGGQAMAAEFGGFGLWMLAVLVALWDVLFLLVDRLLGLTPAMGRKR